MALVALNCARALRCGAAHRTLDIILVRKVCSTHFVQGVGVGVPTLKFFKIAHGARTPNFF